MKEIYNKVHVIEPTIGQATVYRNINKLVASGEIKKLSINDELDRYDGDLNTHYHFICTSCNKIIDIFDVDIVIPNEEINDNYDINIESNDVILYGKCKDCFK